MAKKAKKQAKKKAVKKSAAKGSKKSSKKSVEKSQAKAKAATPKKPATFTEKVSGAYHTVVDSVTGTNTLRNKMSKSGDSESE